jgi:fibronectin-binding autotransporter adhesin
MKPFHRFPRTNSWSLVLLLAFSISLHAAEYVWFPQGDGSSFSDPGNWYDLNPAADPHNPSGPPGAGDRASLESGANVTASSGSVNQLDGLGTATLTLTGPFSAQTVAGGGMTLGGAGKLTAQTVTSFLNIVGGNMEATSYTASSVSVSSAGSLRINGGVQSPGPFQSFLFNVTGGSTLDVIGAAQDVDGSIDSGSTANLSSLANLNTSQATLSVGGNGTTLDISANAQFRNNSLDITSGAQVTVNGSVSFQGANASGTSSNASSSWQSFGTEVTIGNGLTIGQGPGTYTLFLRSGARIGSGAGIVLGNDATSRGNLTLTESANVELGSSGTMIVGQQGQGVLSLDDSDLTTGKLIIGRSAKDNQFIAGNNSIFGVLDELVIGEGGRGSLHLLSGAQAVVKRLVVGRSSQSNNMATVEGALTTLSGSGRIDVGEANGRGTFEIRNNAQATPGEGLSVGIYDGSVGMLDIHDAAQITTTGGTAIIGGGQSSQATAFIRNGGKLLALNALIFAKPSGTSTVRVIASPSDTTSTLFQATDQLEVGFGNQAAGPTLFQVTNGAFVAAGASLLVGNNGVFDTRGGSTKVGFPDFPPPGIVRVGLGGFLKGSGNIIGNVEVEDGGKVAPGTSPGILTVQGNYQMKAGSQLEIEVFGTAAGTNYDRLVVTGNAMLTNGTLLIRFLDGFSPKSGHTYNFLQAAGGFTGSFTNISVTGVAPGFAYHFTTNSGSLSLQADNNGTATSAPRILTSHATNSITLSWPSPGTWVLQSATNFPPAWTDVPAIPSVQNDRFTITLPTTLPRAYFRLRP